MRVAGALATGTITPNVNFALDGTVLVKDANSWVRLSIAATRKSGNLTNAETVGALPTGFRPASNMFRPVTPTAAGGEAAHLFIGSDGALKIYLSTVKTAFYGDAMWPAAG